MRKVNFEVHEPLTEELVQRLKNRFNECVENNQLSEVRAGDERIYFFEKFLDINDSEFFFNRHLDYCKKIRIKLPLYMMLMINRTWFEPGALGSGAGWHRDSGFQSQHKTFCYLSNVGESNGPFSIYDHSNYWLSLLENPRTRIKDGFKLKLKTPDIINKQVTGPQGFSFSCCSNFIHRGLPVESDERYMITVYAWNRLPPKPFESYFLEN